MGTELQGRLTGLSAPGPLLDLAQPHPDLESWWKACPSPEVLLWLAARACTTGQQRRAVLACLAELNRRAQHGARRLDPRAGEAVAAAEAWGRDSVPLDQLLAAERAALAAAAAAGAEAAEINARARALFRCAPRARAASFSNSRALGALADWREADRNRRLALAAAGAARAAADAARAEAASEEAGGGASADLAADRPDSWAASVGESAGYAAGALAAGRPAKSGDRNARHAARLVRRRLPCPQLD
jgi:hypothetical protein